VNFQWVSAKYPGNEPNGQCLRTIMNKSRKLIALGILADFMDLFFVDQMAGLSGFKKFCKIIPEDNINRTQM